MKLSRHAGGLVMVLVLSRCALPVAAEDETLFSEDAGGIVELTGQSRLVIQGIPGTVSVRLGREDELRYMARARDNRREERPVALWLRGRTMILRPAADAADQPLVLEVAVSPGIAVEIEAGQAKVMVAGLQSSVQIVGRESEVDVRGISDTVDVELSGGTLRLEAIESDVTVDASGVEARIQTIGGDVTLELESSAAEVGDLAGQLDADLDTSTLVTYTLQGPLRVNARGGAIEVQDARRGGELELEEATLVLTETRGAFRIDTDSAVSFQNVQGSLNINSYGGAVQGVGAAGPIQVTTSQAEVRLENIGGNASIKGEELTVILKQLRGDLTLDAVATSLIVEGVEGAVDVKTEFGDVSIEKAAKEVKVHSRDGDVRALHLSGPLDLRAEGNRVEVSWDALGREKNSYVENARGDVYVRFPARAGGRLEAEAPHGRIESTLRDVRVSDDGNFASGVLGRLGTPTVQVKSGANLYLGVTSNR